MKPRCTSILWPGLSVSFIAMERVGLGFSPATEWREKRPVLFGSATSTAHLAPVLHRRNPSPVTQQLEGRRQEGGQRLSHPNSLWVGSLFFNLFDRFPEHIIRDVWVVIGSRNRDSEYLSTSCFALHPIISRRIARHVAAVLSLLPTPVRVEVEWEALVGRSRELSMSGILGLVETDILFAEPGTQQTKIYRILQSLVGIGCLWVLSRICKAPCWEFSHTMYGIKQPQGVEAREFWLRQESWTEMSALGLSQEDTSYHRINQGSGPQIKILWTYEHLQHERDWWTGEDGDQLRPGDGSATIRGRRRSSSTQIVNTVPNGGRVVPWSKSPANSAIVNRDAFSHGKTPNIYTSAGVIKVSTARDPLLAPAIRNPGIITVDPIPR